MTDTKITKTIYSQKFAEWLIKQGFELLEVNPSTKKVGFLTYEFEDTEKLSKAMRKYSNSIKKG